jgi:hypothetical protein
MNIKIKIHKHLLIVVFAVVGSLSFAQEGTSSPYSFYGIGDMRFRGTYENRFMGGLSVQADSISLNLQNPAAHSALRLSTFAVGMNNNRNKIQSATASQEATRTSIDYLAVGLPFKKLGITFGVLPFSSVGYRIANTANINNLERFREFQGRGGVDRVFLAAGYQLNKYFRIGLEANYSFGTVETINREFVTDLETGTRETNTSRLNGGSFTVGLMYEKPLNEKLTSFASFAYTPETVIRSTNNRKLANLLNSPVLGNLVVDEIDLPVENTEITMPSRLNFGFGVGSKNKWLVGAEITHQQSSSFGNRFNDIDRVAFENATRFVFGGYYIPKYNSFTSYLSRVVYRAGFRFENTGLIVQDQSIQDYGMTFGLGMPLGGALSKINVGFEYGQRGTTQQNLVKESYFNISIGLTFNDRWFIRSKYD